MFRCSPLLAAFVVLCAPVAVNADVPKAQCIEANTKAQDLRRDRKFAAAREQLRKCADASCPGMVRDDCTKRLDELERLQPTVVLTVRDATGNDITAAKVTVDGAPLAERLDGSELAVDPGEHTFVFEVAGRAPLTKKIVLALGEKARRELIVVGGPPSVGPTGTSGPPTSVAGGSSMTTSTSGGLGTQKAVGLIAGGVGVAGVAVGAVFGLMASSAWSQQKSDCPSATNCPNHAQAVNDHSTMSTDGTISTVAFAAGAAFLAGGALLFFTAQSPAEAGKAALVVAPTIVGREGGGVRLSGSF
jgi:hypothetical protein